MDFPFSVSSLIQLPNQPTVEKEIIIYHGLTTLLGPNGSGKTQILRGLKQPLQNKLAGKKVRFVSAGRMGPLENYRSDYDGHRGESPLYESASFGNKDIGTRRHNIETVLGDYQTLSARPDILIKVNERLRTLFKREIFIEWDDGNLKVKFANITNGAALYSSAREASGLLHVVAVLTSLYDDDVAALLLDEPEVSLHPQLQSFLLNEMKKVAGDPDTRGKKLIFVATHSTELLEIRSVENLPNIVFVNGHEKPPIQLNPQAEELRGRKIQTLLKSMGQEHKLAFFSKKPLLIEGPSDSIICSSLNHNLDLYLEAAGSQILPCGGTGQIPVVAKLMKMLGKKPVILADADSFADNLDLVSIYYDDPLCNQRVQALGHADLKTFCRNVHRTLSEIVTQHWEDIREKAELHAYWLNRPADGDENQAKRRASFAVLMSLSDTDIDRLNNSSHWKSLSLQLVALMEALESAGCFILRKGSIEAYYATSDQLTSDGKPSAAIDEVDAFNGKTSEQLKLQFGEIVRGLSYAANIEAIDECKAIRELVLAIGAPTIATLAHNTTNEELMNFPRRIVGTEKASLFSVNRSEPIVEENPQIKIDLKSSILNVSGFPVTLSKNCNPVDEIARQLQPIP